MRWKNLIIIALSAFGTMLILTAATLGLRGLLQERLALERKKQYATYDWYQEPTIIPPTSTPLPTSTIPPTLTPTFTVTPTPQPQPPTRLVISKINVNSAIHPIRVNTSGDPLNPIVTWPEVGYGVAHDQDSANPGEAGNILLLGHNNYAGQVFRRLNELDIGDEIIVYTQDQKFVYVVQEKEVVKAILMTDQDAELHAFYLEPKREETLTLISCWPYSTYTHRIYVVAKPMKQSSDWRPNGVIRSSARENSLATSTEFSGPTPKLNHLPGQFDLGLKLERLWNPGRLPFRGLLWRKPVFWQKQGTIDPGPQMPFDKGRKDTDLAQVDLAQSSVVLTLTPGAARPGLGVGAFIDQQRSAALQRRCGDNIGLHLPKHGLCQLWRIGHKVLNVFTRFFRGASNLGKVALVLHPQQCTQVVARVFRLVSHPSAETCPVVFPVPVQRVWQFVDGFGRQIPTRGVEQER